MLAELAQWLFGSSVLSPHGFCLSWEPGLLWLHALSDTGIGVAYFSIPFALIAFIQHRPDLVFRPVFGLFAAFILLCGAGHWIELLTLWVPAYGLEGVVKAATAVVSVVTAAAVWKLLPQALALPSPAQLRQANLDLLEGRQAERRMAEAARQASDARDLLAVELLRKEAAEKEALLQAAERERQAMEAANAHLDHLAKHLAQARDRAEQANRAKSRFLAGMSHELRTPLNGILGYAHLLHIEGNLNPSQSARVDAMLETGKHLLEMITCVLDLSEIEAERVSLRPVELDVQATAAACLDLIRPAAEAKGLALSIEIAPGTSPVLVADRTRLRQILLNLLGNAAKFTSQGQITLRIQSVEHDSALRIEIVDTGPGIPEERRHRLFQDFERLDAEATRMVEGAGLGLALASRLAGLMGGCLGCEDNPGGGSVFWLKLPVNPVTEPSPMLDHDPEVTTAPTARAPVRAHHVLVVDDVLMNRDIASSFLRRAGYMVTSVEGGAEAVAAVASRDLDVVLMDVTMPGMDGLEATRRIRRLPGTRGQIPILAVTAQAFTEQVAACRAAGMDMHLPKPFDPDVLVAAVRQAIAERNSAQVRPCWRAVAALAAR